MDLWEETLVNWANAVTEGPPVKSSGELRNKINPLIKKILPTLENDTIGFMKKILPCYFCKDIEPEIDSLCTLTGILVYVSINTDDQLNCFKEAMQTQIDARFQNYLLEFLMSVQKKYKLDKITIENVKSEINNFLSAHKSNVSMIGDGIMKTPIRNKTSPKDCGSPLQQFFTKTPKGKIERQALKCSNCTDWVKRNKELHSQLEEMEHDKTLLEEDMRKQTLKCHKLEKELQQKVSQIQELEQQWNSDTEKNNHKLDMLHKHLQEKGVEEKRLKNELRDSESYISILKGELMASNKAKGNVEDHLQELLQKNKRHEEEAAEAALKIAELKAAVSLLENQVSSMKENFPHLYELEHSFETSFNRTLDTSISCPENMGVVIDKLLSEQKAENADLKEEIAELKTESDALKTRIENLQEELKSVTDEKADLNVLNLELREKVEEYNKARLVLEEVEGKLIAETKKVDKMFKENFTLSKKLGEESRKSKALSEELEKIKESKETLELKYLELTYDFKDQLATVSKLTTEIEEKHSELQKTLNDFSELKKEHENVKKSVGYVDACMIKNLEKLETLIRDSDESTGSFASCLSVESKIDKLADLLRRLEVYNVETAESRAVLEKTCVQLNDSIVSLKSELLEREEKEKNSLKTIKDLQKLLDASEIKFAELQESYTSKIDQIKKELVEKSAKIEQLGKILNESKENQNALLNEKNELIGELTKVTNEFLKAEEKVKNLEGMLNMKENDHAVEMSVVSGEMERLKIDLMELSEENASLNGLLEESRRKLGDSYAEIKKLEEENDKILTEKNYLFKEKEAKAEEINHLKRTLEDLENSRKNLSCELLLAREKLSLAAKEYENLNLDSKEKSESIRKLQENCRGLQLEKEKIETELIGLKHRLEGVIAEKTECEVKCKKLREENAAILTEKNNFFGENERKIEEINNLKKNMENLENLNKNLSCELLLAKEKLNLAAKENETLNLRSKEKSENIQKLQEKCKNLESEKTEVEKGLIKIKKDLEGIISSQKSEYGKLKDENKKIIKEKDNLFKEKEEKSKEINNLKKNLEELESLRKNLSCELLLAQEKLNLATKENENLNLDSKSKTENLQKLQENCRILESEKEKTEKELIKIKKELKEENEKILKEKDALFNEKTNEINDLKKSLEEIESLKKSLSLDLLLATKKLDLAVKENADLKKEKSENIEKLQEKCRALQTEKEKTEEELVKIRRDLEAVVECQKKDFEAKIKEAQTEKESRLTEIKNIKSQRDDLLKRLEVKSTELLSLESLKDKMLEENSKIVGELENDLKKAHEELKTVTEKLNQEIEKRSEIELQLNEERKSVESLTSEIGELESQRDKILKLSREMKSNVTDLKSLLSGKELEILYDKGITESASQFSFLDEEGEFQKLLKEGLSPQPSLSSFASSGVDVEDVEIEMEGLNREIITAKKSLFAFLKATAKHLEELKIKEDLIQEMSKEHKYLENRISSLSDLNSRLTKEILESKSLEKIEVEFKEKELECLKAEVESLTKASELLKGKLSDLERVNGVLSKQKEETSSEISRLREENRTLTNDLQNRVANRLRQQNACLGLITSKQETELELERVLTLKNNLEQKIFDLRKSISHHENKNSLEILLTNVEQKLYIASEKLLHSTYLLLKWGNKTIERRCSMIEQGDDFNDSKENVTLKDEQQIIKDKLKLTNEILQSLSESVKELEGKLAQQAFSDSLEEISIGNKTFDIVNLEEHVNDRTFSINKPEKVVVDAKKETSSAAAWVVSPPSKTAPKPPLPRNLRKKEKPISGASWVVPMDPPVKLKKAKQIHRSAVDLPSAPKEEKLLSKSSSLSEIDYSPPGKRDSKCEVEIKKESPELPPAEPETKPITDFANKERILEKKIWDLQKEILENVKENERLKSSLYEAEQKRKKEKAEIEKTEELMKQKITAKYEAQLEELKAEMKSLYNKEIAKHKTEQSKMNSELLEQNKTYKEHIDELRIQQWHLGEKYCQEKKLKDDLERKYNDLMKKYERSILSADQDSKSSYSSEFLHPKDGMTTSEFNRLSVIRQLPTSKFPTMPTEDEDEIFDNRRLEDLKAGRCQVDAPETRLSELQFRNSLCLPHLKSSYPAETQFHNPRIFKENELKFGHLNFGQESQSLTDSDHSMTRSLLPDEKTKKKEQTCYKKPGPPTPSKNGGRLSLQSGDLKLTPRNVLKEQNDIKGTPSRLKLFFTAKNSKRDSIGCRDENTAPVTPRGKKLKIFNKTRKPFGVRDY